MPRYRVDTTTNLLVEAPYKRGEENSGWEFARTDYVYLSEETAARQNEFRGCGSSEDQRRAQEKDLERQVRSFRIHHGLDSTRDLDFKVRVTDEGTFLCDNPSAESGRLTYVRVGEPAPSRSVPSREQTSKNKKQKDKTKVEYIDTTVPGYRTFPYQGKFPPVP